MCSPWWWSSLVRMEVSFSLVPGFLIHIGKKFILIPVLCAEFTGTPIPVLGLDIPCLLWPVLYCDRDGIKYQEFWKGKSWLGSSFWRTVFVNMIHLSFLMKYIILICLNWRTSVWARHGGKQESSSWGVWWETQRCFSEQTQIHDKYKQKR